MFAYRNDVYSVPSYDHDTAGPWSTMQCVLWGHMYQPGWNSHQRYYWNETGEYVWVEHVTRDSFHMYAVSHNPAGVWRTSTWDNSPRHNHTSAQFIHGPNEPGYPAHDIHGIALDDSSIFVIAGPRDTNCSQLFKFPKRVGPAVCGVQWGVFPIEGTWTKVSLDVSLSSGTENMNPCMTSIVVRNGFVHGVTSGGQILRVAANTNHWWESSQSPQWCEPGSDSPDRKWITHDVPTAVQAFDSSQQLEVDVAAARRARAAARRAREQEAYAESQRREADRQRREAEWRSGVPTYFR